MPWIRALLSIFIIYHLVAVALAPNSTSFLGRVLGPYYLGYANMVGAHTPWNFFSPDPADNFRIEYKVRFSEISGTPTLTQTLPEWYDKGTLSPNERRDLYLTRFLMMDPTRLASLFGPWMCRKYPEASEVVSQFKVQKLPPLDRALLDPQNWKSDITEIELPAFTHYCKEFQESEAL